MTNNNTITVYGTKITSDIAFPLDLSQETETRYEVELSSNVPKQLKNAITCGFPLYWAHDRKVYLYSDRLFDDADVGQPWCYEVKDIVTFYWVGGEEIIYYELQEQGDARLLAFWFIHLLLPLYFTLEEKYDFFHGGAVEVEGKAVMFTAPSMGGKSTMTDYFLKQGHPLISDDKIATFVEDGKLMLVGSHPYHRPYRKFEELGYRSKAFSTHFAPLHVLYLLEKSEDGTLAFEEVKGFEKFDALDPHYLYSFDFLRAKRFAYYAKILNNIRIFRVKRPWDMEKLAEVYGTMCVHSSDIKHRHRKTKI